MDRAGLTVGLLVGLILGSFAGYLMLSTQLSAEAEEIDRLKEELKAKDDEISRLQAGLSNLQSELEVKLGEISNLEAQVSSLLGRIAFLEDEVEVKDERIARLKEELERADVKLVAVSFSRIEDTRSLLVDWISRANRTIYVMVMVLTADELAEALIDAWMRGVNVSIIIDDKFKDTRGSDFNRLLAAGVDIRTDGDWRLMHHKIMVIDGYIVVTGSYNWSSAAEEDNFENVIILSSETVAAIYLEEFHRIWGETKPGK